MQRERIWCLFSKKLAGEANPEELAELEEMLRQDPDMHYALQNVTDIWHLSPKHIKEGDEAFLRHMERLKSTSTEWKEEKIADDIIPFPTRPSGRKILYLIASIMAVAFAGVYLYKTLQPVSPGSFSSGSPAIGNKNEISTVNGSKMHLNLPDGSSVWLNAGSTLNYDKTFSDGKREVTLSGEAFFDVTRNPRQPFIIHTPQVDIQVLGTSFNVRSYPAEQKTVTSLIKGSLEVRIRDRQNEKFILKPDQKLEVSNFDIDETSSTASHVSKKEPLISLSKVNHYENLDSVVVETAWVDDKLIFDNESLKDIATSMERWYNVEISIVDSSIAQMKFHGAFENQTIQQALELLSLSMDGKIKFSIQGNKIVITK